MKIHYIDRESEIESIPGSFGDLCIVRETRNTVFPSYINKPSLFSHLGTHKFDWLNHGNICENSINEWLAQRAKCILGYVIAGGQVGGLTLLDMIESIKRYNDHLICDSKGELQKFKEYIDNLRVHHTSLLDVYNCLFSDQISVMFDAALHRAMHCMYVIQPKFGRMSIPLGSLDSLSRGYIDNTATMFEFLEEGSRYISQITSEYLQSKTIAKIYGFSENPMWDDARGGVNLGSLTVDVAIKTVSSEEQKHYTGIKVYNNGWLCGHPFNMFRYVGESIVRDMITTNIKKSFITESEEILFEEGE